MNRVKKYPRLIDSEGEAGAVPDDELEEEVPAQVKPERLLNGDFPQTGRQALADRLPSRRCGFYLPQR